jgi:hypothetical protein
MGRKRKNPDDAVARVNRSLTIPLLRDRTVSVHTTPSGRLGQSTSSLPSRVDALMPNDQRSSGPELMNERPSSGSEPWATTDHGIGGSLEDQSAVDSHYFLTGSEEASAFEDDVKTSDNSPLREWANLHRATYLDEMIRHEGRAGVHACHRQCGRDGTYKCKDCFGCHTLCQSCFVEQHTHNPLHRPQVRRCFGCAQASDLVRCLTSNGPAHFFRTCQ